MLNIEVVKSQTGLESLTDEQLAIIVELSNNTTSRAKGVLRGQIDTDIKRITGIEKDGNEKLHLYLERAVNDPTFKVSDTTELDKTIETLTAAKADLEAKIKAGSGSEGLIKERDKLIETLRANEDTLKSKYEQDLKDRDTKYKDTIIDGYFNKALAGLTFKSKEFVSLEDRERFINSTSNEIKKELNPQVVKNAEGKDVLQFFKDGELYRNAANKSYPYTPGELLESRLGLILDKGQNQNGGGGKGGNTKTGSGFDFSQHTTKVGVDEAIMAKLQGDGIDKYSPEFTKKWTELRAEVPNFDKLPES